MLQGTFTVWFQKLHKGVGSNNKKLQDLHKYIAIFSPDSFQKFLDMALRE